VGRKGDSSSAPYLTVLSFLIWFIGAFEKLRNATVSLATSVRPSVLASTERTLLMFDIEDFSIICRENSSFVKI
jgi:hypothetical protein